MSHEEGETENKTGREREGWRKREREREEARKCLFRECLWMDGEMDSSNIPGGGFERVNGCRRFIQHTSQPPIVSPARQATAAGLHYPRHRHKYIVFIYSHLAEFFCGVIGVVINILCAGFIPLFYHFLEDSLSVTIQVTVDYSR